MNILEKIVRDKRLQVEADKTNTPLYQLKNSILYTRETISLKEKLHSKNGLGIIAEFKRQSPSKGQINKSKSQPKDVAMAYEVAGATAMSILTDKHYFGGSNEDIIQVRNYVNLPILRKEFIIDPYQIHEAKSIGADVILLIGAVLNKTESETLCQLAQSLGLEVLYEVHDKTEIYKIPQSVDIIGVNNRDLKAFKVDFNHSKYMYDHLPENVIKISESGISNPETIKDLSMKGFKGFLIGETFMKTENPGKTCTEFISQCKNLKP